MTYTTKHYLRGLLRIAMGWTFFWAFLDKLFVNNGEDDEPWEIYYSYEKFRENQIKYLSDRHCGDCVAVPCSCVRCHAEDLYGQDTVTWENKKDGWKLYNEYLKEIKK